MSGIHISVVPEEHVLDIWPRVEPMLEQAVKRTNGRYTTSDVLELITREGYHLWVAFEDGAVYGTAVTYFTTYPRKKYLTAMFISGEQFGAWKEELFDILAMWAIDNNCDGLEAVGRPGWAKALQHRGCHVIASLFECPALPRVVGE